MEFFGGTISGIDVAGYFKIYGILDKLTAMYLQLSTLPWSSRWWICYSWLGNENLRGLLVGKDRSIFGGIP